MKRVAFGAWTGAAALALGSAGCGNQMMRQPSFSPLESPRAAPPADSVPIAASRRPEEGLGVASASWGQREANSALPNAASTANAEPTLPPPNLSDNARNEPTPPQVDKLKSPAPFSTQLIHSGRTLFLNRCVQCHNPSGHGVGMVGTYLVPAPPDLADPIVQKHTDGAIFWHITMGQGKMPAFRRWTTPGERWALTSYVRSLKGAPSTREPASARTATAPYPVYGGEGFEFGASPTAHKVLPDETPAMDPAVRANLRGTRFGQE